MSLRHDHGKTLHIYFFYMSYFFTRQKKINKIYRSVESFMRVDSLDIKLSMKWPHRRKKRLFLLKNTFGKKRGSSTLHIFFFVHRVSYSTGISVKWRDV